ncbi:MAG: hypothetical protein LBO78_00025 [Rickettsiales bacterium]|nr:hypothetical protein [Rickettsiales bacterium]
MQKLQSDDGEVDYYAAKSKVCNRPNNVRETPYTKDMGNIPAWMQAQEAVAFSCETGYILGKINKSPLCINSKIYCPIGEVLASARDENNKVKLVDGLPTLRNPKTDMVCLAPEKAKLRNIAGSSTSFLLECPEGQYSSVDQNSGRSDHITCVACPEGRTSLKGSNSSSDCSKVCGVGEMINPDNNNECIPCDVNSDYDASKKVCVCKPGFSGVGIASNPCVACPAGNYCPGGNIKEACDAELGQFQSATGRSECKVCPSDAVASDGITCSCRRPGKRFDEGSNACK